MVPSPSWIFTTYNTTLVDCQAVILNHWKIYHLWAPEKKNKKTTLSFPKPNNLGEAEICAHAQRRTLSAINQQRDMNGHSMEVMGTVNRYTPSSNTQSSGSQLVHNTFRWRKPISESPLVTEFLFLGVFHSCIQIPSVYFVLEKTDLWWLDL